jgi:hypothetical protein
MDRITDWPEFLTFEDLEVHILEALRFPGAQPDKLCSYAWVPALYWPTLNVGRRMEDGVWRAGEHESPVLSVHYLDVDNKRDDCAHVTEEEIAHRLADETGGAVRFFTYTSFSSTPRRLKFRAVMDTTREITRVEMRRVHLWMQERVLKRQGDDAIYDDGDMVFAPPRVYEATDWPGAPLDIDDILAREAALHEADPALRERYAELLGEKKSREKQGSKPARELTPEERSVIQAKIADVRTRTAFTGIDDPLVFNPVWLAEIDGATCHYDAMLSVLGKVWRKNGGDLSRGEMQQIWDEIDARWGGYMQRTYGNDKPREMITFIMQQAVIDDTPQPVKNRRALAKAFRHFKANK